MKRVLVGTRENGEQRIDYYLISDTYGSDTAVYGFSVRSDGKEMTVPGISPSEDAVRQLLTSMMHGAVSPVSASDAAAEP